MTDKHTALYNYRTMLSGYADVLVQDFFHDKQKVIFLFSSSRIHTNTPPYWA